MQKKMVVVPILGLVLLGAIVLLGIHFLPVHHYGVQHYDSLPTINPDLIDIRFDNELQGKLLPVAIIGSGPAGLSAAVYTSRFNLHTVVFEGKRPGGQLMNTSDVENWPGITREKGPKIIDRLKSQAVQFGALFSTTVVESIDTSAWPYRLKLDDGSVLYALTIILAMGASPVTLKVPGEEAYWGKGVTSCAVCDAPFFRDKRVVVIGGGDAAAEEALQLASHAEKITVLVRGPKMRASHAMQQHMQTSTKISVRYNTQVQEVRGDGNKVTSVLLRTERGTEELPIDGIFLAIGHTPNTALVQGVVACDKQGYVIVAPQRQHTSIPGIFAAGDVADHFYRQAGIASGDGIKAAIDAASFLRHHGMDDAFWGPIESQFFTPQVFEIAPELKLVTTVEEFEKVIGKAKVPVVVDFFTSSCSLCKSLMPAIASVVHGYGDKVVALKVDGEQLSGLMDRYGVTTVPTLLVFKNGMVVARSTTISSRRDIQSFIAQCLY